MKSRKKQTKLHITEEDFLLANRRAARMEEIEEHGKQLMFQSKKHKTKKDYNRKSLKLELKALIDGNGKTD